MCVSLMRSCQTAFQRGLTIFYSHQYLGLSTFVILPPWVGVQWYLIGGVSWHFCDREHGVKRFLMCFLWFTCFLLWSDCWDFSAIIWLVDFWLLSYYEVLGHNLCQSGTLRICICILGFAFFIIFVDRFQRTKILILMKSNLSIFYTKLVPFVC